MSKNSKLTINTYNQLGKKYLDEISKAAPVEREAFIKLLPKKSEILEIGSAGGRDAKAFVKKGFKVTGIDLTEKFLKIARKDVPQAKFYKMDARKITLPSNSFDAIWAVAVLLHIERSSIKKVLKKFNTLLKPGGWLYVMVKQGRGTKLIKEKGLPGRARFFVFYSKSEIKNLVHKAKFNIRHAKIFKDPMGRKDVKWIGVLARKSN